MFTDEIRASLGPLVDQNLRIRLDMPRVLYDDGYTNDLVLVFNAAAGTVKRITWETDHAFIHQFWGVLRYLARSTNNEVLNEDILVQIESEADDCVLYSNYGTTPDDSPLKETFQVSEEASLASVPVLALLKAAVLVTTE